MLFNTLKYSGGYLFKMMNENIDVMVQQTDTDILTGIIEMLTKWVGLSDAQQRAFVALINELKVTSQLVESSTGNLSTQFQELVLNASCQSKQLQGLLEKSRTVKINDEIITLPDTISNLDQALSDIISEVFNIAKLGITITYDVNDITSHIDKIDQNFTEISKISENQDPSQALENLKKINEISTMAKENVDAVLRGTLKTKETLQEVTTVDMSDNVRIKEHIADLMKAILEQNNEINNAIEETSVSSNAISMGVLNIITGMQFQDRTSQRLEHIIDSLEIMGTMLKTMDEETEPFVAGMDRSKVTDLILNQMIDGFQLSEVKERFIKAALRGEIINSTINSDDVDGFNSSDDVDLF